MKIKQNKEIIRSFQSAAPKWIKPVYDIVQVALNDVLKSKSICSKLARIKLTVTDKNGKSTAKARGMLWHEIQAIIGNPLKDKINNSAWYNRILMTNLIALLKSRKQQLQCYQLLKDNNFKINQVLRQQLVQANLYPTNVYLTNLAKSKQMPVLPDKSVLKLNYAFSDRQMFKQNDNLVCQIKIGKTWREFRIYLPSYIRYNYAAKICKPVFIYNKNFKQIICQVPYKITAQPIQTTKHILGIDLGKVKFYSGTVLYGNGTYSHEYVPSHYLNHLNTKLTKLNRYCDQVYNKIKRVRQYYPQQNLPQSVKNKQGLRYQNYQNSREKRTRLKKQIEWLMANEIITIARQEKCSTIHLENLTWVNNQGGKWDFNQILTHLNYLAELVKIKLILINPKNTSHLNPLTHELGFSSKRDIVFKDLRIDRDQLASLNIALKNSHRKIKELHNRQSHKTKRISNRRHNYLFKQKLLNLKQLKKSQIVVFLRKQVKPLGLALTSISKNISNLVNNNLANRKQFDYPKSTI